MFGKHHQVDLLPALNSMGKGPAILNGRLSSAKSNACDVQASMHHYVDNAPDDEDIVDLFNEICYIIVLLHPPRSIWGTSFHSMSVAHVPAFGYSAFPCSGKA
jgi:hypothetical protein